MRNLFEHLWHLVCLADGPATATLDASNPDTPPEELARLAREGSREVQLQVAANPSTPADALFALGVSDDSPEMGVAIAGNTATDPLLLTDIASRSESGAVRLAA